ncbi:MAG: hypothetical protein ACD_46C00572G0003 [uncultured bacterium]|nr:MAG: hypothetical protein ACD_46C00572G0003 [uncultured bacterium]
MKKRIPIFLGLVLTCIAIWLLLTPMRFVRQFIERVDNLGYDLQLHTRALTNPLTHSSSVAIIDIDDRSLAKEGRWPWPRAKIAALVDELQKQGAAVIAFDMFFSEKQPNISEQLLDVYKKNQLLSADLAAKLNQHAVLFDEDLKLAKSLSSIQSVLAISFLPTQLTVNQLPPPLIYLSATESNQLGLIKTKGYISNIPLLQKEIKNSGFINVFPDNDGIIRHVPLIMQYRNGVYPALALQAILLFLGEDIRLITPIYHDSKKLEGIQIGQRTIPTDERGQVLIPFIGKSYTFPYFSATDVLHHEISPDALLGKILFIGTSATGLGDLKATAIQNPFPGVEIQATLANGLLENNFSYKPAWTFGANIFLTFLFGCIAAFIFPYLGPRTLGSIIVLLPISLLFLNNWIWDKTGLILSFFIPVILVLVIAILDMLYGYLFETRRREQLKEMFGQYVPEKHIDEMLRTTSNFALHGESREMSVLFADIRSFTTISEGMSASELVDMLNTFFTPMTETIFKHRGTIDKYVGDLIMAFWGAPLKDKYHARHALQSAVEMQQKVKEMQSMIAKRNWPEIKIGIGINSGIMNVGDMGSRYRRNYTVLGDNVNLASRTEGLTKFYGVDIIVAENTQHDQPKFIFRKLDLVRVKGKKSGVAIYEVIGYHAMLTDELAHELKLYHQALDDYFHQRFDQAYATMEILHQQFPDKKIYRLYIDRINEIKQHTLPPDWDGVFVHTSK